MKSTIRNLTTAFFAWLVSVVLLITYSVVYAEKETGFYTILILAAIILCMGICSLAGFLSFLLLSLLSNIFNWSESKDYLVKILFSITLYLPLYFLTKEFQMDTFWYWSLAGTLTVITFDYKHLFTEHFSFRGKKIQTENH